MAHFGKNAPLKYKYFKLSIIKYLLFVTFSRQIFAKSIIFMHQTTVADFFEAIGAGDHGEEPARPGEGLNVVPFEKLAVEIADKALHRGIGRDVLLGAPTQEETRLAANLVLHLALGSFGNVDFVAKTLEAKVFEWLVGAIDLLLFGIHFEAILLKEGRNCIRVGSSGAKRMMSSE